MKIYLVGGAVRDQALGIPVVERDWVVVGGTPDALIAEGYKQVGHDFPVFIHPITGEEYALARTERKLERGYFGFSCDFSPLVTLEEDLARRDLTINAMAIDEQGHLIDPYHGMDALNNKELKHVSTAFIEDPVRILRVARFAARYHRLGFRLAKETRELMYAMVVRKEANHLVAERVWQEWQKSLTEKNPEVFIEVLRACGALEVILPELNGLFGVPNCRQSIDDSVDTGIAMLKRIEYAASFNVEPTIRFASLLLELGKGDTAQFSWPFHLNYVEHGMIRVDKLCQRLRIPNAYRDLARLSIQFQIKIAQDLPLMPTDVVSIFEQADAFRRPERFHDVLHVCETLHKNAEKTRRWVLLLKTCTDITTLDLKERYEGPAIKQALRTYQIAAVELKLKQWALDEK
jgi:tRNA nucleotidyltransferase (CCA-adding enzyme)